MSKTLLSLLAWHDCENKQQTSRPLDKSRLSHHTWHNRHLDCSWTFHLVFSLAADVAGLGSASWNRQMDDGVYIYAEENLDTVVSETPLDIWWKIFNTTKWHEHRIQNDNLYVKIIITKMHNQQWQIDNDKSSLKQRGDLDIQAVLSKWLKQVRDTVVSCSSSDKLFQAAGP